MCSCFISITILSQQKPVSNFRIKQALEAKGLSKREMFDNQTPIKHVW